MPRAVVVRRTPVTHTFRTAKVQGMFDLPRRDEETFEITADMPLEEQPWQLGAIVGASGSGKSTIAREVWPDVQTAGTHLWTAPSLVDDFPEDLTPADITSLLNAVGLSSAPAWLRPYSVLSTGQQFRADLARSLTRLDPDGRPVVFDEFTSTVDRTVAKAVCVATAKHIRRTPGARFVAVTCHKDVLPWLQPDWHYDTDQAAFAWGSVQPRPVIDLCVREGSREAWRLFRQHHYLSGHINRSSRVFLTYVTLGDEPAERLAGFFSILPQIGHRGWWRGHRIVVLPDMQGLGIGNRMIELAAEALWVNERKRYREVTSAPGIVHYRRRRPAVWRLAAAPGQKAPTGKTGQLHSPGGRSTSSAGRLTTSWVYLPTEMRAATSGGTS